MSSALNLIEKKAISWLLEPRTIFMFIWVSSLVLTPAIYAYSPVIWGMMNG